MNRRSFVAALAGLPLVGQLLRKPEPKPSPHPDTQQMPHACYDVSSVIYEIEEPHARPFLTILESLDRPAQWDDKFAYKFAWYQDELVRASELNLWVGVLWTPVQCA